MASTTLTLEDATSVQHGSDFFNFFAIIVGFNEMMRKGNDYFVRFDKK